MTARSKLMRMLRADDGVSVVEFGFTAPLFLAMVFGTLELGYGIYADSVLSGAVQAAGRNSGLESAQDDQSAVDARVTDQVTAVVPSADLAFARQNYQDFTDVGRPEDFDDANNNDEYDDDECFTDENDNESWDDDVGADGQGGANDVVLYTVTMSFNRFIPVGGFFGLSDQRVHSARTTLRNQPFSTQGERVERQICP